MNDSKLIYQWLGYLSNPVRRTQIHVELHPSKELEFRNEYHELTGHPLLLSGNKTPFYVWKPSVNKWGTQRRVYFFGGQESMPETPSIFDVREGRAKKYGQWRINNKDFLKEMFIAGFFIGDNVENPDYIRGKIPKEFIKDFDVGFNLVTLKEQMEMQIRDHCNKNGLRTFGREIVSRLRHKMKSGNISRIMNGLEKEGIIARNTSRETYTLQGALLLNDEIEQPLIKQAIAGENNLEKREYLIETYARDRGWVRLAKETFGDKCMCDNCANSFVKPNGENYIEVHHITPLHEGGEDSIWNLSVVCAHHHRMAHFAKTRVRNRLKEALLEKNGEICGKC